ncbi:hypothetical protein EYZ11_002853 [Aspergillus tanneri]|uniref:Uncharacterized protein n=1 Tax=Aspergillus tanneri TaxID=1220188 RepID=A0A4S3JQG4_9EURO|nr:uncharacterized protein ATNIH1004_008466 [Aspergillus tanneri]KAA8644267.1 hypothetical protein ATNIH1004_008466 [Aspergillus tanneri]THC97690.1 hypothetical protein EYZ11_002853 [Aspergillus tanneri]
MLDEALPTFYLKSTSQPHISTIYFCQHGNEPSPAYSLHHPDPTSPSSKNRYAVALVDPYVSDIVFGEILIIPEWTQPILSAEAIRQNGGVAPPPEPILPTRFTIHLYNPDQQVTVQFKPKSWNSPATWTFEMPQHTFRQPSNSSLDRTQSDPATADTTPKLRFSWRRDSKLSKDLTCLLSGKTTTLTEPKTKSKEPDITLSIFKGLRELTLYEPNLYRVEMEDFKGLEVVLLLGAATIRDVYFTSMKDSFHVSKPTSTSASTAPPAANANSAHVQRQQTIPMATGALTTSPTENYSPESSSQQRNKQEQLRMEEERQTQKFLEEEENRRRRRQAEIDQETRRLQQVYGQEEQQARTQTQTPSLPPRPTQPGGRGAPAPRFYHHHHHSPSTPHIMSGGVGRQKPTATLAPERPQSTGTRPVQPKKSSFFGLRKTSEDGKLNKKRSSMF